MKKLLMGNEAIAMGAIKAGVRVVSGYPGTPSTEVLETIAKNNDEKKIYVEWSINEKVALEVAAGAAYTGARSMVTMKQVGLNVASDPLMSLAYIGVKGGMVIMVADDPGPISSQTEQDTRRFSEFCKLPIFDPSTPEEAFRMIQDAFELSEKLAIPVFVRPTTRVCHACASIEVGEDKKDNSQYEGFVKDSKWTIFPALTYKNHKFLEDKLVKLSEEFSRSNLIERIEGADKGSIAIATGGVSYSYVKEAIEKLGVGASIFKVSNPHPFPFKKAEELLKENEDVIVFEELDPVIEDYLLKLAGRTGVKSRIHGKRDGKVEWAGELSTEKVMKIIARELGITWDEKKLDKQPDFPMRPPVLCAGCPHRASFYAVKCAMKGTNSIFTGDIGCYTLGNAKPLDMVDTCLCMGAGVTVAQGLKNADDKVNTIAFIGDSTFFHTGIPGIINSVYNDTDITVIVLDNSTTAMTGHQPHPGIGVTMMQEVSTKIDIEGMVRASGVKFVKKANPFELEQAIDLVKEAVAHKGVSVVIFEAPCIAVSKCTVKYKIEDKCINCKKCIREIGCPAISVMDGKVCIDNALCYGCGLCTKVCPTNAIVKE